MINFWCAWEESDLRPSGPQPDALSTELQAQNFTCDIFRTCAINNDNLSKKIQSWLNRQSLI